MADWPMIAARLALYGDLGLLFGIPLFALYAPRGASWPGSARFCAAIAVIGLLLAPLGFALQVAAMSGTGLRDVDPAVAQFLLMQTAVGWAFAARMAALLLALVIALLRPRPALLTLCGAVALASLAWSGHGAAGEGMPGMVRLAAAVVHILAASAWIGALVMLFMLVAPHAPATSERIDAAHAALRRFSIAGTLLVALIVATGAANTAFIVGLDGLAKLGGSTYGQLLLAKLTLFLAMIGCAALNRFRLTPRLAAQGAEALASLRLSIAIESLLALVVLALVAWLGMLEPPV